MTPRHVLSVLAGSAAGMSLAAGIAYVTVSPSELPTAVLVIAGFVGATILLGCGLWQQRAAAGERRRSLLTLAIAAVAFAVASGLGIAGARFAQGARWEPTGLPVALHAIGIAVAVLLLVAVVGELKAREPANLNH